jgi:outer membrane murein-binding lipoprotein Lpp
VATKEPPKNAAEVNTANWARKFTGKSADPGTHEIRAGSWQIRQPFPGTPLPRHIEFAFPHTFWQPACGIFIVKILLSAGTFCESKAGQYQLPAEVKSTDKTIGNQAPGSIRPWIRFFVSAGDFHSIGYGHQGNRGISPTVIHLRMFGKTRLPWFGCINTAKSDVLTRDFKDITANNIRLANDISYCDRTRQCKKARNEQTERLPKKPPDHHITLEYGRRYLPK